MLKIRATVVTYNAKTGVENCAIRPIIATPREPKVLPMPKVRPEAIPLLSGNIIPCNVYCIIKSKANIINNFHSK
ncbi:hypothetical protein [Clostridium sp.]|uniref:hypothetical protein n=1 Tax=Clostridium sp. TaxID=1506 RepID=UPI003D6CD9BE